MSVGVFDSGVGGLSVLRHIQEMLPKVSTIYLADQARAPYGERTLDEVRTFSLDAAAWLIAEGADVVVMACNSASAAGLSEARGVFPEVPFVGMEPAVKPAAANSNSKRIGVLATKATFQGELFATAVVNHTAGVSVLTRACPDLVDVVESGDTAGVGAAVQIHVDPLVKAGVDTIVLGCTHFPFLIDEIEHAAGPHVAVIDPSLAVATQTARMLPDRNGPVPEHRYVTTGDPILFADSVERLLGIRPPVEHARLPET